MIFVVKLQRFETTSMAHLHNGGTTILISSKIFHIVLNNLMGCWALDGICNLSICQWNTIVVYVIGDALQLLIQKPMVDIGHRVWSFLFVPPFLIHFSDANWCTCSAHTVLTSICHLGNKVDAGFCFSPLKLCSRNLRMYFCKELSIMTCTPTVR